MGTARILNSTVTVQSGMRWGQPVFQISGIGAHRLHNLCSLFELNPEPLEGDSFILKQSAMDAAPASGTTKAICDSLKSAAAGIGLSAR